MMRRLLFLPLALLLACAEDVIPPFGDLHTPAAIAIHQPSKRILIASQDQNELRVFDIAEREFLVSPAASFPLSVPTVRTPRFLEAGDRFVFVVSGADGSVGFVDTDVPAGAFGPQSVDDAEGDPITVETDFSPTATAGFVSPHTYAEDLGDHLLVAGLLNGGSGGRVAAVRPPFEGASPAIVASVDVPDVLPADIALEPGFLPLEGGASDCRSYALADVRVGEAHQPGIWIGRVEVAADGSIEIRAPDQKIEVEVEVVLPDGTTEARIAPVRALAFAPVPFNVPLHEAVAVDPCAARSGRIFAALDRSYCSGTTSCPNFVAIDLPTGRIARDAVLGGPAAYELPAAPIDLISLEGPIEVRNARLDFVEVPEDGPPRLATDEAGPLASLVLVSSSDGGITYVSGGVGTRLLGPAPDRRAGSDPVFLLDAGESVPGVDGAIRRTDRRGTSFPSLDFPPDARPRRERWTAGFELALPGLANLGGPDALEGDRLRLPEGSRRNFLSPVRVLASDDLEEADRLVPLGIEGTICEGYPIVAVEEEGRSLRVRMSAAFSNPPACQERGARFAVLPPRARPWTLSGSTTGFAGRATEGVTSAVRSGERLLFLFAPPAEEVERGATFEWATTSGFSFLRTTNSSLFLPASMAAYPIGPPNRWRVAIAYTGSNTVGILTPSATRLQQYR